MSSVDALKQLAESRGLYNAAEMIESYDHADLLQPVTQADPLLDGAPAGTVDQLLQQMIRRGLEPSLVAALLDHLEGRPLEQGLVAWDALSGSIVTDAEAELLERLRDAARPLASVLPPVGTDASRQGMDLNKHPASELIAEHAGEPAAPIEAAKTHSLGALAALHRQGHELFTREPSLQSMIAFGRALHLARLPTLASVYLDFLVRVVGRRDAVPDLAEALLDARAPERLPAGLLRKEDATSPDLADLAEYILYRGQIAARNTVEAYSLIEVNRKQREEKGVALSGRFRLVQTELSTLFNDKIVPVAEVDAFAAKHPLWRYAQRMRVVVSASWASPSAHDPLERLVSFVHAFGNELEVWYQPMRCTAHDSDWKRAAGSYLSRELLRLPHVPGAWKALVAAIGTDDNVQEAADEVEDGIDDQCELD
jgi:hypothetical protein